MKNMTRECLADLRTMIDKVIKNLRVLSTIDLPFDPLSEMLIINMVAHRLDNETQKAYELQLKPQIYLKWAEILTFLKSRCHILESIENSRPAINIPASFRQATLSSSQYSKPTHKSVVKILLIPELEVI
jgi:ethanolamine utilization protein EutA (predicted chaperonin)